MGTCHCNLSVCTCICVCIPVSVYTCVYVCVCSRGCVSVYGMRVCTSVLIRVCTCVCTCVSVYISVCVCVWNVQRHVNRKQMPVEPPAAGDVPQEKKKHTKNTHAKRLCLTFYGQFLPCRSRLRVASELSLLLT